MNKKKYFFLLFIISLLFLIAYYFDIFNLRDKKKTSKKSNLISTAYYNLKKDSFKTPVFSKYGGIASVDNKILYVSGESDFFLFEKNKENNSYKFKQLQIKRINNNKDKFVKKNENEIGDSAEGYFGVKDVLLENFDNYKNKLLFVSSLNYIVDKDCYNLSVFLAEIINVDKFEISEWKNIFSSKECLNINLTNKPKFAAASAGGRISKLDGENILLSIGDFYADGQHGPILSQDISNDYGKILKINISDYSYKIFSLGHRNPQGLYVDKHNNIFSTEHGPDGGDELNFVIEDQNYGWPIATFGTEYGMKVWPKDQTNNTHNNFQKPIFSWGNQFGISNLIVYENAYFKKWNQNLIVSSLATQKLARMIFDDKNKSIIYMEYIPINKRIRDIIVLKNGKIALLTDSGIKKENGPEIILLDKVN